MNVDFLDVRLAEKRQTFQVYKVNDFLFLRFFLSYKSSNVITTSIVSDFFFSCVHYTLYTCCEQIYTICGCFFSYIFRFLILFDQFDELTCITQMTYMPDVPFVLWLHMWFLFFILNRIFKQIAYQLLFNFILSIGEKQTISFSYCIECVCCFNVFRISRHNNLIIRVNQNLGDCIQQFIGKKSSCKQWSF